MKIQTTTITGAGLRLPAAFIFALQLAALPAFAADDQAGAGADQTAAAADEEEAAEETTGDGQEAASEEATFDRLIVTGTRVSGRTTTTSVSPIDVFDGASLDQQASFDLTDQLRNISPSFNTQRFPIADGTAFIRPANLRNLPPDQTLVLINGHRRHRSALVNLQTEPFGTVNQGAQAVDFGIIPAAAIGRVEILRDGSSAQYGSDAIAGVINIILNNNPEGIHLTAEFGSSYDGDGDTSRLAANIGLPLGETGFFNITADYVNSNFTSRGSPRPDALAVGEVVGIENVPFNGLGQRWGNPDVEGIRLFFNGEVEAGENISAYGHGNYVDQDYRSSFFFRTPVGVPGVTPRATLLVDSDGDGLPDPVDQSIIDDILNRGLNPNDFVTADPTSPSGFVALNPIFTLFPGGYTPTFGANTQDFEGVLGVRGELDFGLTWDLSGRFGENDIDYVLENSINPGLGINSPLNFRPGTLEQRELGVNLDFAFPLYFDALAGPVNIAFGAEYRREVYEIGIGDPASFEFGPTGTLFGVGSDGFQGDGPESAGEFERGNYAGYLDIENDLTDWLTLSAAGRIESPNTFETSYDWKVAARVQPHPWFALRATVNTGFRVPTPGQINTLDVTTTADASGQLVPLGTFPVNSPAAIALGAQPLKKEDSFSVTTGLIFTPLPDLTVTVDYYNIDVDDRIALANRFIEPGSPEQQALIDAGVPGAALIGSLSFFSNAVDTTSEGIDVVATKLFNLRDYGLLTFDARHAYNRQRVNRFEEGTIDAERVFDLENQLPNHRTVLTVEYQSPWDVDFLVRGNRFGEWQDATFGEIATFGSEWLIDLIVTAHFLGRYHLSAGAENIGDNFPDPETNGVLSFLGATRPVSSPFGFDGGRWFVRLTADL